MDKWSSWKSSNLPEGWKCRKCWMYQKCRKPEAEAEARSQKPTVGQRGEGERE
jgi:hypothetical protein